MEKDCLFSKLISINTDVKTEETNVKDVTARSYDMEGHAQKCVERCCKMAHKTVHQLHTRFPYLVLDDHQVKLKDLEIVGE